MNSPIQTPFGPMIVDERVPPNSVFLIGLRYKVVQDGLGEPPVRVEILDMEATAKASAVIFNIGEAK